MDNKDYPKARRAALKQGWRVEPTATGERFLAPDGIGMATWHRRHASSDPHALEEFIRRLVRAGFDPRGLRR